DSDELLTINDIGDYWSTSPPKKHIHIIIKLPLLSLEETLSCILPPITNSPDCATLKITTKTSGNLQISRLRFNNKFNDVIDEKDVRNAIKVNICQILNKVIRPNCIYLRKSTDTPSIPDFNYHLHVLEDIDKQTFSEFYQMSKGKDVIQQIYNYIEENELRYRNNNSHNLRSHSKSFSNSLLNNQAISSFADKQSSSAFDRRMIHSSCLKCPATKTKEEKVAQATAKNKAKPSIYNILCNFAMLSIHTPLKAGSFFSRYKDFTIDGPQNIAIRISASYYFGTKRKVNYLEVREGKKPKPDSASTSVEKAFETEEQQGKQPEIRNHEELKKAPEEKSEEEIYNDDIIPFAISDDVEKYV
ncbi:7867_t:CDS:2, partial [Funneliformis geosporum]